MMFREGLRKRKRGNEWVCLFRRDDVVLWNGIDVQMTGDWMMSCLLLT